MKFSERLASLGFATYNDYLNSDHWEDVKRRYRESGRSMRCAVCGKGCIQLHHHDYSRLGEEALEDFTPLCRGHHYGVHQILKEKKWGVWATARAVAMLRGEPVPAKGKKGGKRKKSPKKKSVKGPRKSAAERREEKLARREASARLCPQLADIVWQVVPDRKHKAIQNMVGASDLFGLINLAIKYGVDLGPEYFQALKDKSRRIAMSRAGRMRAWKAKLGSRIYRQQREVVQPVTPSEVCEQADRHLAAIMGSGPKEPVPLLPR